MYWSTRKKLQATIRLRHRRADVRLILLLTLLLALLAASTVVSADAILRLPKLWQATSTAIDAAAGPRLPGTAAKPSEPENHVESSTPHSSWLPPSDDEATPPEFARLLRAQDYAESWRQAGPGWDRLGETLRSHQVNLGPRGRLTGQIVALDPETGAHRPLEDLRIRLLHRGTLAATGRTDELGVFEVMGLTTGTYSLIAANDDSLLAYALHVRVAPTPEDGDATEFVAAESTIGIRLESAAIVGADVAAALSHIATLQTEDVHEVSRIEPPVERIPEPVRPLLQTGAYGTTLLTHRVQLQADGRLIGRVRYLHPESGRHLLPSTTRVMLLREGEMITDGWTDELGCFDVAGAAPGVYSLVAITVSEELAGDVADWDMDPSQPVGLIDRPPRRPGYATFAVEVLPAGTLTRGDQPLPPPRDTAAAGELLELDFALIDAYDMVAYTRARASALQSGNSSFWGDNALVNGGSPRIAPRAPASPPQQAVANPPGGGGPPGMINTPFFPPDTTDTPTMSPATL